MLTRLLPLTLLLMVGFTQRAEAQLLYVSDINTGTIGVYTTSGAVVNASLVSGLRSPVSVLRGIIGIAVSGSNLYVASPPEASAFGRHGVQRLVLNLCR